VSAPQVSVILPVYQRAAFLQLAAHSVFAQTFRDWELIVADDGSTDDTPAVCRRLGADARVRVLELAHSGNPALVRNAALREARGRYVAFLDSDDLWMPRKLELQLEQLRADPSRPWSYTGFVHIDVAGAPIEDGVADRWAPREGEIFAATITGEAPIRTASIVMAARSILLEAGCFDEALISGQDYDLWMRMAMRHPVAVLRSRLTAVRVHPSSHSSRWPPRALECRDLSLRKMATLAGPEWRSLIGAQRRRNAATLAACYLAQGERGAMVDSMRRSVGLCWHDPRWWASCARTLLRSMQPVTPKRGGPRAR
jgi:glycosyltransferase involved in cell wall biosynthesis